jgi:hypothetical protein
LKRFSQVFALAAVVAGVFASTASALAFADADYFWPTGGVGENYHKQLLGRTDGGNCDTNKCTFTKIAGEFPPGISMSSGGTVTGIPQKLGTYSFWLRLSGNYGGTPAEREFSINVNRIKLKVATQSLPVAPKGNAYSPTLVAEGGSGPKTWTVTAGRLPDGLSLDASSGAITGTPTVNGDFVFTVKVSDSSPSPDTKQLVIRVVDPLAIAPLANGARVAEVGRPYARTLKGSGGTAPYKWTVEGTLPEGLALNGDTGVLSGVPALAGRTQLKFTLTDANGLTQSLELPLNVAAQLALSTSTLRAAKVGRVFSTKLTVLGGVRPLKWRLLGGKLPAGVKLDKTGKLTGTPRAAGTFRFRVVVTDALRAISSKPLVLKVQA